MLRYFYKNKARYEKGQMAPLFIAILAILIIMAMVTVNLSKVSLTKTDSSNAVDAGALAAGSVMANVFNALAVANSQMEASYWEFFASISVSFILAILSVIGAQIEAAAAEVAAGAAEATAGTAVGEAGTAVGEACPAPYAGAGSASGAAGTMGGAISSMSEALLAIGKAMGSMENFVTTAWGISIAVTAYYIAQYYFYTIIRDMAEEGWESGIEIGHQFAFMNSGIGSKLREDDLEREETGVPEEDNNYRNKFSDFMDNLGHDSQYTYPWLDGQHRYHYVTVKMGIDDVDTFDLRVAAFPYPAEIALLATSIVIGGTVLAELTTTEIAYGMALMGYSLAAIMWGVASGVLTAAGACMSCCNNPWTAAFCCPCWEALCAIGEGLLNSGLGFAEAGLGENAAGLIANAAAIASMIPLYPLMAAAWSGLLPGPVTARSGSKEDALPFIICWIDEVVHDRRVRVDTTQHHQGMELGLWQMQYPDKIQSFSIVDFTGYGKIHSPDPRFDPSIIQTDLADTTDPYNPCILTAQKADTLAKQADGLYNAADIFDAQALKMEQEAESLQEQGLTEAAEELSMQAEAFREQAQLSRTEAAQKEQEAATIKAAYPQCFS